MVNLNPEEFKLRINLSKKACIGEITVREAAIILNISEQTFYRWINKNKNKINVEFPKGGVNCRECDLKFYNRRALSSHFSLAHRKIKYINCVTCGKELDTSKSICSTCSEKRGKISQKRKNSFARARRKKQRREVIKHYGNKCACCSESEYGFLTIEHKDGGGRQHKMKIGKSIYRWIKENGYPSNFEILCYNCNCSKGALGYCPHEKNKLFNMQGLMDGRVRTVSDFYKYHPLLSFKVG